MPEISRFFGIIIRMYHDDHAPPHFHADYAECKAVIDIRTLMVLQGNMPARALGMVTEWATLHQGELLAFWDRAQSGQPLEKIPPLA
ncbi:MAG: DUF4160 domain-containing protein [Verrucomicrobiota bacterium]|nr:DUF4160 domain-containing protein [Verrucomicrobiota bacterium]